MLNSLKLKTNYNLFEWIYNLEFSTRQYTFGICVFFYTDFKSA